MHCYCKKRGLKFNRAVFEKAIEFDPNSPPPMPMVKKKKKKGKRAHREEGGEEEEEAPSAAEGDSDRLLTPDMVLPEKTMSMSTTVDQIIAEEDVQTVRDKNSRSNGGGHNSGKEKEKVPPVTGLRVKPMMVRIHDKNDAEILYDLEAEIVSAATDQAEHTAAPPRAKRSKRK